MPRRSALAPALALILAAGAHAQPTLYGISGAGSLYTIDHTTGAATLVGSSGVGCAAAAADTSGRILTGGGNADQIISVDPVTGAGTLFLTIIGRPVGYGVRGMAITPANELFVVVSNADTSIIDRLGRIDMTTGVYTAVGNTGVTDLQGLACSPTGQLYALGINNGGRLFTVDSTTGVATLVGLSALGGNDQSLEFFPDGRLFACRTGLSSIDPATGISTAIGPTGFDIRGTAVVGGALPPACYANCDASTTSPVLNVADFTCFLGKYAAGDPYANCDESTAEPVLNVADFTCFLGKFAGGCP